MTAPECLDVFTRDTFLIVENSSGLGYYIGYFHT